MFKLANLGVALPVSPRSSALWDAFWHEVLAEPPPSTKELAFRRLRVATYDYQHRAYWPLLTSLGCRKVFFIGNGVSELPHFFQHAGFACTAVDFSRVALTYAEQHPPTLRIWADFIEDEMPPNFFENGEVRNRMVSIHRPAPPVEWVVEDFLDYSAVGEFDALAAQNILDCYDLYDGLLLACQFERCLRPGGVAIIESESRLPTAMGIESEVPPLEPIIANAGFRIHLRSASEAHLHGLTQWRLEHGKVVEKWHKCWWRALLPRPSEDPVLQEMSKRSGEEVKRLYELDQKADMEAVARGEKLAILRSAM